MQERRVTEVSDPGLGTWDLGRVFYLIALSISLVVIVRQYGGWNLPADMAVWRRGMAQLRPQDKEATILQRFHRVQSLNRSYRIGVVSVTEYRPAFGGDEYRVYDIGYYDMDKRVRPLVHITCRHGRIERIDDPTPREFTASGT